MTGLCRHRSGDRYQNISAELKVPKNTEASIILQWKKFGTTKTLPRALVREVAKNPMVLLCQSSRVPLWR
jgi:hypothetical protein